MVAIIDADYLRYVKDETLVFQMRYFLCEWALINPDIEKYFIPEIFTGYAIIRIFTVVKLKFLPKSD